MDLFTKIIIIFVCGILIIFIIALTRTIILVNKTPNFKIICIKGHQYYKANFEREGYLAIVLDDNGKPIRCEIK